MSGSECRLTQCPGRNVDSHNVQVGMPTHTMSESECRLTQCPSRNVDSHNVRVGMPTNTMSGMLTLTLLSILTLSSLCDVWLQVFLPAVWTVSVVESPGNCPLKTQTALSAPACKDGTY